MSQDTSALPFEITRRSPYDFEVILFGGMEDTGTLLSCALQEIRSLDDIELVVPTGGYTSGNPPSAMNLVWFRSYLVTVRSRLRPTQ